MTGGESEPVLSPLPTEQQPDTPPSLAAKADCKVEKTKLVAVAKKLAGVWDELAAWLSPELFTALKLKEIKEDHSSSFSRARAVPEMWSDEFGNKATYQLLIQSLCQMNQRVVASGILGSELVEFVEPL